MQILILQTTILPAQTSLVQTLIVQILIVPTIILLVQTASHTFWPAEGEAATRTEKCRAPDHHYEDDEADEDDENYEDDENDEDEDDDYEGCGEGCLTTQDGGRKSSLLP